MQMGRDLEKIECLKNIKLLNTNLKITVKDQIFNKKNDNYKEFQFFEDLYTQSNTERKNERFRLAQQLNKSNQLIKKFQDEVKTIKPTAQTVEKLKKIMENAEQMIGNLKEQIHLKCEELLNDEKILSKEIDTFDKKIENWLNQKYDQNAVKANLVPVSANNESDLLPEVVAFDRFLLQNGGHRGNWDEYDHALFLKSRLKHKTKDKLIDELSELIATKNRNEIEVHDIWYDEYSKLNETKKLAIKNWKDYKKNTREQFLQMEENLRKFDEEKQQELQIILNEQKLYEKQEKVKKLNEWKLQKEIERREVFEKNKRENLKKLEKEFEKKQKQMEAKQKLDEYKREKDDYLTYLEIESEIKAKAERDYKAKIANLEIQNFQQRDLAAVKEKMAREKEKEIDKQERLANLEKLKTEKIEAESDPTRLFKMTDVWKNRLKSPRTDTSRALIHIPHRAVPSWRQPI